MQREGLPCISHLVMERCVYISVLVPVLFRCLEGTLSVLVSVAGRWT